MTHVQSVVTDEQRLAALHRYDILGTEPEPAFDRIASLAAHLFEAPVSIINFITDDRQWFKSTIGFEEQETALDISFCVHTIAEQGMFVVEDLAGDERFADNPYVVENGIRFYAGVPLTTPDGEHIGTLCILDTEPQSPSEADLERLSDLASMVVDELELRREQAERKRALDQLRRNREQLRTAQQIARVGGWTYDVQTETLAWTDETYRIHGLAPDQPIGIEESISFYVPEDRPVVRSHLQTLIEEGGEYDLEQEIVTANGERRWIRIMGEAHQRNGTTVRVSGAIQDITERRQAEEDLRIQNEVLQTVFDNTPVVIIMFDADGEVLLANSQFEDVFGVDREAIAHRSDALEQLCPSPSVRREARSVLQEASGDWTEFRLQAQDGTPTDIMGAVVPLSDGRRVGIGVDITEKKERQKRLRLMGAAIEHTRVPILITEADPLDEPGPRVVYANPAVEDVTGYTPEEMQGQSPRILQGEATDREALDRIREALQAEEPVHEVVRNYRNDGTMYWNDIYIAPVQDDNSEVTHYVSVQEDVTDDIRKREELKAAKEAAEEADRIKTALLTNMNHEFRTPLTSIISFSRLISSEPELAGAFAEKILSGGTRLLRTLNAVMDLAELEGEQAESMPEPVDVAAEARSVVDSFAPQAPVRLEVQGPDEESPLYLDQHLVERVLMHLVSNAVKFTEEGNVTVEVQTHDAHAEIAVVDTGIGIPAEEHARVFDEFYQVSEGTDRTHEGNGLGLAVVEQMVDRMDGAVHIESAPGEGTRVTVRLPTQDQGR